VLYLVNRKSYLSGSRCFILDKTRWYRLVPGVKLLSVRSSFTTAKQRHFIIVIFIDYFFFVVQRLKHLSFMLLRKNKGIYQISWPFCDCTEMVVPPSQAVHMCLYLETKLTDLEKKQYEMNMYKYVN